MHWYYKCAETIAVGIAVALYVLGCICFLLMPATISSILLFFMELGILYLTMGYTVQFTIVDVGCNAYMWLVFTLVMFTTIWGIYYLSRRCLIKFQSNTN